MKKFLTVLIISLAVFAGLGLLVYQNINARFLDRTDYAAKAQEYQKNKNYTDAVNYYEKAKVKSSSNPAIYLGESEIYVLKNRDDDAVKTLIDGLTKVSANYRKDLHLALGNIYYSDEDYKNASTYYDLYLVQNPSDKDISFNDGRAYFHQNNFEKAKTIFTNLTDYPNAMFELSVLNIDDIAKAQDLNHQFWIANGSPKYIQTPKWDTDLAAIKTCITDKKPLVTINALKGAALDHADRCELAVDPLKSAIQVQEKISPYVSARVILGECYLKLKNYTDAQSMLENALNTDKSLDEARELLVSVYEKSNQDDKAIAMMKNLIALNEQNVDYKKNIIAKLVDTKKYEDALSFIEQVLKLLPDDPDMIYLKADIYINDLDRASDGMAFLTPFITKAETLPAKFYDIYGWGLFKQGKKDEALENIRKALAQEQRALYYYHIAMIEKDDTKTRNAAKNDFMKAIDLDSTGEISDKANTEFQKI